MPKPEDQSLKLPPHSNDQEHQYPALRDGKVLDFMQVPAVLPGGIQIESVFHDYICSECNKTWRDELVNVNKHPGVVIWRCLDHAGKQ